MNVAVKKLVERAVEKLKANSKDRILITLSGIPGSGKTTLAQDVCKGINSQGYRSCVVPMDGYHYYRHELDAMEDPIEAHRRRGAPFTFDAGKLVQLVKDIGKGYGHTVKAPGFNHELKDPSPDQIVIDPDVQIVIIEGLYLLLKDAVWHEIAPLVDDKWFIKVDFSVARTRVAKRHVKSGITDTIDQGYARFDDNDGPNGEYLIANSIEADYYIESENEPRL